MTCYCYILRCVDGTFYTGWSTDPQRRLRQHNAGRGAKYTRIRLPVELVYVETQPDRGSAMRREHRIKQMSRLQKQRLVQKGLTAENAEYEEKERKNKQPQMKTKDRRY